MSRLKDGVRCVTGGRETRACERNRVARQGCSSHSGGGVGSPLAIVCHRVGTSVADCTNLNLVAV